MIPHYTYTSSVDFINNLSFDYIETWSFQRGWEFEENKKQLLVEYDKLKLLKAKINSLSTKDEEKLLSLEELLREDQYLINDKGRFHPSAKKTNTFKHNDPIINRLTGILRTEIVEVLHMLCSPVYREAMVFYDVGGKLITHLNICLSCHYMETTKCNYINADYKAYDLLKRFFIDIGHDVEEPDYFVTDYLEKTKRERKK